MSDERGGGSRDLGSPLVFVPTGEPEPSGWQARHPGWVKFPATMVPRGGELASASGRPGRKPVFPHDEVMPGSAGRHPGQAATPAPGLDGHGEDPIAAYARIAAATDPAGPGGSTAVTAARDLAKMKQGDANERAFLRLLRWAENGGAPDEVAYRARFGHGKPMKDADMQHYIPVAEEFVHSDKTVTHSTAAGAYGIVRQTWKDARAALRLPDFSPASQDKIAVWIIEGKHALEDVRSGLIGPAFNKLKGKWSSLPGGSQSHHSPEEVEAKFQDFLKDEASNP